MQEEYAPEYNKNAVSIMANRRLKTHGTFFLPFLQYEVYKSLNFIVQYLTLQLEKIGENTLAQSLKNWMNEPNGLFAQPWVSCVGKKIA